MSARIINPTELAENYRENLRSEVAQLDSPLRIVGFLAHGNGPAATYARYTRRGCESVGIDFDLRTVDGADIEHAIGAANGDPSVQGVFVYYPMQNGEADRWLRELVDPRKDVEGMHSFWSRYLYENRRFLDEERTQQAILPCTPLAILKLLQHAGLPAGTSGTEAPLAGMNVCVINRSDIVGRPLSAMLANDGAEVISFDIDGALKFQPSIGREAHVVSRTDISRQQALAQADVVVTGVPSKNFELIGPEEIKYGAICANFSEHRNFEPTITDRASAFIPRVGPMTVTMAMRNTVRLYRDVQSR
ncbi:bifunctional methylenetetrahydrofolate dehydrogenase/methenyltetrahydrofolate cyclohydrolase [Paenarthrobacter sp. Z7-10]|uniref:bifunctional methylenetetrahydrofolate dehydrogenase/methenyltetrahydrofolate cyclohydrolase n=1 Tax=Paenarthrobacter sp. Z7-10 TaxID=2787635 RepID=UPI0022A9B6FA|nr:bifunctional methylenetetrahydrofolate dehydrogenase/methenyltetrahydrofolate cyclohydrolase [Paenarthrobacter sp. Z7-10]MCZ2402909.1 bifunctional methylenetetrahydrofolate dehydrogenase/methenyltetrahydrofolate cyclohydrolase [Paenarthrobacter sp. Z7-10]